jgi:hypothetical protein
MSLQPQPVYVVPAETVNRTPLSRFCWRITQR